MLGVIKMFGWPRTQQSQVRIICGTQIMVCGNGILKRISQVLQEHMMCLLTMTTCLQVGIM